LEFLFLYEVRALLFPGKEGFVFQFKRLGVLDIRKAELGIA